MSDSYIKIADHDNVVVALKDIPEGTEVLGVKAVMDIPRGHKMALADIAEGENIVKYGFPIGHAKVAVKAGEQVHTQNTKTNLSGTLEYKYEPVAPASLDTLLQGRTFQGYRRADGRVGIRNEVWIVNTVGCVNKTAEVLAMRASMINDKRVDGVYTFVHPFGCSQLGDDHENTRNILADLVKHPNAGAVLVLGLGCENNTVPEFKKLLGDYDESRVRFLVTQEVGDELVEGVAMLDELMSEAAKDKREECPVSELVVGLKCGGSDGLSGITANPLVGRFSDSLIGAGGSTILTEVPEMFGAETILMNRAESEEVFDKTVHLINDFKEYFLKHDQVVYENPSPGNKDGGITTLEDKSLGCIQKGGRAPVVDVIPYAGRVEKKGLTLLNGPGNDIVSTTAMTAAGAVMILFTTGRGNPMGAPVPTLKIATNSNLAERKPNWIDFNAGVAAEGKSLDDTNKDLCELIIDIASGKEVRNEINGYREISIFKDGVIL